MNKFIVNSVIILSIFSFPTTLFAINFWENVTSLEKQENKDIVYPQWKDFDKLEKFIETYFIKSNKTNFSWCIYKGTLCPNPKYTSIAEKQLKLIIVSTYKWNEEFYVKLLSSPYMNSNYSNQTVKNILAMIPSKNIYGINNSFINNLWNNYASNLIESSFWINFSEIQNNSTGFISVVKQKIDELKRKKCNAVKWSSCYVSDLSNFYLPSLEELLKETIYLNWKKEELSNYKDDFIYTIIKPKEDIINKVPERINKIKKLLKDLEEEKLKQSSEGINTYSISIRIIDYNEIVDGLSNILYTWNINQDLLVKSKILLKKIKLQTNLDLISIQINRELESAIWDYQKQVSSINSITYTLEYTKNSYTLEEALAEIEKTSSQKIIWVDIIERNKEEVIKKDYKALMNWEQAKNIPEIFKFIPKDAVFSYIKNPQSLISVLNNTWDTTSKISWINVNWETKKLLQHFFELDDFSKIEKNLKNEMVIALLNLDFSSPEIVIIISEKDKNVLSSSTKAQVLATKWGYIFISPSKKLIEKFTKIDEKESVYASPDLEYVWWKKWALVKDMFIFAGDSFFEKMTSFDNFVLHLRKFKDFSRLQNLQQLVWAYKDFNGNNPNNLNEIINFLSSFWETALSEKLLSDYQLEWDIVINKNIWSLKNLNTITESNYDLNIISRTELDSYKYSILKYREIWRANLDPMWIIVNTLWDGLEVDFFMTPIPAIKWELGGLINLFKNVTKDKLDFIENPKVRNGILSLVYWFDTGKVKQELWNNSNFNNIFLSFNKNVMDGKDILDYLGWEFAFSIWWVDPDIFEWWNIEKIDAFISIQITNEEKGKELVEIVRNKLTSQFEWKNWTEAISKALSLFAKPFIEEYKGNKIYFVEDIPFPFTWKIGLSYTYVNNFLVISLNKTTIKKIIDTSISWDKWKSNLIDSTTSAKWTFFWFLLDWVSASKQIKDIMKNNTKFVSSINRYLNLWKKDLEYLLSLYYSKSEEEKRLGKKSYEFKYIYWFTTITGKDWEIFAKIDESKTKSLSGATLEKWNSIKPKIDTSFFWWNWGDLSLLFNNNVFEDYKNVSSEYIIESIFNSEESLFRNLTYTMSLWDDIVWYKLRIFREKWHITEKIFFSGNKWITIGIVVIVLILWSGAWFLYFSKKRKNIMEQFSKNSEVPTQNIPQVVIQNSEIPTQDISQVVIQNSEVPTQDKIL